jgi:Leucine-rich repeat (LRR) protein
MRRKVLVGILIGLIFGIAVVSSSVIAEQQADKVVTFPDKNLEKAIRRAIGKPEGPIYAADLKKLTEFDASDMDIIDLTGLEYCTLLEELNLRYNEISGISALSKLTNLKSLWLGSNKISNISALSKLTNLEVLYIGVNRISDIKPLVDNLGLSKGDWVHLTGNPLSPTSIDVYIPQLEKRGVRVDY